MFPSLNFWKRTFIKPFVKYVPTIMVPIILFVFNIKLFQLVYTCYEQGIRWKVYVLNLFVNFLLLFFRLARDG